MSSSGRSELPIIAPDLQRSHTLVLRSFHSRSQLQRPRALALRSLQCCSGSSTHSHPCSHSPCMAGYTSSISLPPMQSFALHGRIHLLFFCSQQLKYIWDTPTLTKPGVVFQKKMLSLTTRDRSFRPLRTTCKSIRSLNCIY